MKGHIQFNLIGLLFLTLSGCDLLIVSYKTIRLNNHSDKPIYYQISYDYPNIEIPVTNEYLILKKEKSNSYILDSPESWNEVFTDYFPSDTLLIFYFDPDTIKQYSWDEIRRGNKIICKNIYSKQDLQAAGWEIHYP